MEVKKYINQTYLSAKNDREVDGNIFVIDAVYPVVIQDVEKVAMRMKNLDKPMILNQTNLNHLMEKFGEDTDEWINKKVQLLVINVSFNGQMTEGIQVRASS